MTLITYIITALFTMFAVPESMPDADPYPDISAACADTVRQEVPSKWQRQILDYCEHRSYASTRYTVVKSRVDGTQIHDRDRPFAWRFYTRGLTWGRLDPVNCEHHRVDREVVHPKAGRKLARNWPFARPEMTDKMRTEWLKHPHDMERFGTRGPHDHNLAFSIKYVPGCYPPEALDRFDVAAMITVKKAMYICERHGCRNKWDIKRHWGWPGKPPARK